MAHGKETPRQKMIGMMYLVLTAMLALNVSKDILDAFVLVDEGLFKTTQNFAAKNENMYGTFDIEVNKNEQKFKPWRDKAYSVKDKADQLTLDIQQLKVEIVQLVDGSDAPALIPVEWVIGEKREKVSTYDVNDALLSAKDNMDKPANIMINNHKGAELKNKIAEYRDFLVSLTADSATQNSLKKTLNTDDPPRGQDNVQRSWEANYFENVPMVAVVTMLTKIQGDIRNAEAEILQNLLTAIDAGATKVNKMEAIVMSKSNYILKGGEFEARVILAAYDSMQTPKIVIGPYRTIKKPDGTTGYEMAGASQELAYDASGKAIARRPASSVGAFTFQGLLQMPTAEGFVNYPFSTQYEVGEASAVISPTKMNVFYTGVENPVSISVSGVPAEKISASMTNGRLERSSGGWVAKPDRAGQMAVVTVTANIDNKTQQMGKMEFRVKDVPDPVAKVANLKGGQIAKSVLTAQRVVQASMENFDFDLQFRVTEFTISAVVRGFTQIQPAKSATITNEQKNLLNGLSKGAKVYFDDIRAVGPDGKTRSLSPIIFTID
jgi:gliding motility-associated protein GldM